MRCGDEYLSREWPVETVEACRLHRRQHQCAIQHHWMVVRMVLYRVSGPPLVGGVDLVLFVVAACTVTW